MTATGDSARCPRCGHTIRVGVGGRIVLHDIDGLEPIGPDYFGGNNPECVGHTECRAPVAPPAPSPVTGHTPEPWTHDGPGGVLKGEPMCCYIYGGGTIVANWFRGERADADTLRAVACVNALAGVADPAAEIARLRAIERAARAHLETTGGVGTWTALRAALGGPS